MSRQLSRIRNLISEIDEIQKQGQKTHLKMSPISALPQVSPSSPEFETKGTEAPVPESQTSQQVLPFPMPEFKPAKISLQLTGNVMIQLQMEHTQEIVEVRRVSDANGNSIEIRFSDGKAIHLPLKDVA